MNRQSFRTTWETKWWIKGGHAIALACLVMEIKEDMFRKDLIPRLLNNAMSVAQIARAVGETPSQIAGDLEHLFRSLKHTEYRPDIQPATCRDCGFEFSEMKVTKPSKCPKCRSRWISEPLVALKQKK